LYTKGEGEKSAKANEGEKLILPRRPSSKTLDEISRFLHWAAFNFLLSLSPLMSATASAATASAAAATAAAGAAVPSTDKAKKKKDTVPTPLRLLSGHVFEIVKVSTAEARSKYSLRQFITHHSLRGNNMEAWTWRTSKPNVLDKTVLRLYDKLDPTIRDSFDAADATESWVLWQRMTPTERQALNKIQAEQAS
jgi:hypothetical protein